MVGSDDLYAIAVCFLDHTFYDLLTCEGFYINEIYIAAFCDSHVECFVSFVGDRFFSAFLCSTEGEENRSVL